jgi:hypothetical protein
MALTASNSTIAVPRRQTVSTSKGIATRPPTRLKLLTRTARAGLANLANLVNVTATGKGRNGNGVKGSPAQKP